MLPATGLYGHIRNNNLKSALLLAGFVVLVGVVWMAGTLVWAVLSDKFQGIVIRLQTQHDISQAQLYALTMEKWLRVSLAYAFVPLIAVAGWFAIAFVWHRHFIRRATRAESVSRLIEPRLYNMIENLTIMVGMPMPRVELIETTALNAYASGLTPNDATVAVTRGLLDTLTDDELEAVLAHEITHIRNRDVRLMVVATIFVGVLSYLSQMMRRQSAPGGALGRSVGGVDLIIVVIAVGIAGIGSLFGVLTRFALSRSREYLADAGAVELTKNPDALIAALRRIEGHDQIEGLPPVMNAMMISVRIEGLFSTHPSVEERAAALQRYAGVRHDAPRPARQATHAPIPATATLAHNLALAPSERTFGKRKPRA